MNIYYFFLILLIILILISIYYYHKKRCLHQGHLHQINKHNLLHQINNQPKKLRFNEISDILIYSEDDDYEKIKLKIKTKIN